MKLLATLLGISALALSGCGGGRLNCVDEKNGEKYSCSCQSRCQGTTSTWSGSVGCAQSVSGAVANAPSTCSSACSPSATCTECTCSSTGEACYTQHCYH